MKKLLHYPISSGVLRIASYFTMLRLARVLKEEKMKRLAYLTPLAIAVALTGCASRETRAEPSNSAMASVGIVNHTGNYIHLASVDGAGGGSMSRWGTGNANICCSSSPRVWYPGMKVRVRWDMPEGRTHHVKEKIVEVEKYDRPGDVYMHFFPNDEVRVVVSPDGPGAPGYPIRHSGKPTDALPLN